MALNPDMPEAPEPLTPPLTPSIPLGRSQNLLVNYISLLSGTVSAKALGLVTVLMLTRYLGVTDFGRYSLIFSYWALLNTLVDIGGSPIMGREIARDPRQPRGAIESVFYLRLLGCLVFLPLGFLLGDWVGIEHNLAWLVFAGVLVAFESFYDIYFSATMQLHKSAQARFFSSLANVLLIGVAVLLKWPFVIIMLIALLNPLLKLALDYWYAPFKPCLNAPDWAHIRKIARDGWPLWLVGVQYILLTRIDTFMLQVLSPTGEHDLGIYAAAFRFSEVMALLINALCPAMLPLLVRHMDEPERMRFLAGTGTRLILAVLMTMSLFIFWYAPWIARVYGSGYEASADCMRILIWSQALVAVNTLCYQLLVIYNAQGRRAVMISGVLMTVLNIGLNFWLIPALHAEGASWATVITEFVIVLTMLWFLRAYTPLRLGLDILAIEALALVACFPGMVWGEDLGWFCMLVFVGLVFALRLLTPASLKALARERLHEAPPTPMSPDTLPLP